MIFISSERAHAISY